MDCFCRFTPHRNKSIGLQQCVFVKMFQDLYPDLNGFEGWMDKKMIFNGLEASCFYNHFALTIRVLSVWRLSKPEIKRSAA